MADLQDNEMLLAAAIKKLRAMELKDCINPERPEMRPTAAQESILREKLARFIAILGGNRSGKSTVPARIITWWFTNSHPHMTRPPEWGTGPLNLWVAGRQRDLVEHELYEKKIKPFLEPGTYKEVRKSSTLSHIVHNKTGNKIMFFSYHSEDEAREKIQGHTIHVLWCDEQVTHMPLFNELRVRTSTGKGIFIMSFTPLIRSEEMRSVIEGCTEPLEKVFKLSFFDNPLNQEVPKEEALLAFRGNSPAELAARLYGDWFMGDDQVFALSDRHFSTPSDYHPSWPHIESVDPAASSKFGFILAANRPGTNKWFVIKADYIKGDAPSKLVQECEKRTTGLNIVARYCDSHEAWFIKEAALAKRFYRLVDKNKRKLELISGLRNAVAADWLYITAWAGTDIIKEFHGAQWADKKEDAIANSTKYHLLDALQYLVDNIPKFVPDEQQKSRDVLLQEADDKRRVKEAKAKKLAKLKLSMKRSRRW